MVHSTVFIHQIFLQNVLNRHIYTRHHNWRRSGMLLLRKWITVLREQIVHFLVLFVALQQGGTCVRAESRLTIIEIAHTAHIVSRCTHLLPASDIDITVSFEIISAFAVTVDSGRCHLAIQAGTSLLS